MKTDEVNYKNDSNTAIPGTQANYIRTCIETKCKSCGHKGYDTDFDRVVVIEYKPNCSVVINHFICPECGSVDNISQLESELTPEPKSEFNERCEADDNFVKLYDPKPQMTAEAVLKAWHYITFPTGHLLSREKLYTESNVLAAMEEHAEQATDQITELFSKPLRELRPLEDLWRKENSPDKFMIPDATEFYKWIVGKVNASQFQKPVPSDEFSGRLNPADVNPYDSKARKRTRKS